MFYVIGFNHYQITGNEDQSTTIKPEILKLFDYMKNT